MPHLSTSESSFVQSNFLLKRCNRYVKVNLAQEDQRCAHLTETDCVCGQNVKWHIDRGIISSEEAADPAGYNIRKLRESAALFQSDDATSPETAKMLAQEWHAETCTDEYQCDSFGEFTFKAGSNVDARSIAHCAKAKYIRLQGILGRDKYKDQLYQLMTDYWRMPKPQLIIEVTGAARDLPHVDKRVVEAFNQGLIQAAKSANAWLVTGGTNGGVMKLVGDAVTKYHMSHSEQKITCIGIASWGIIEDRDELIGDNSASDTSNCGKTAIYPVNQGRPGGYSPLNPGHNHFLLVDNGKEKRFGEEIQFRAEFTAYLTGKLLNTGYSTATGEGLVTPLVLLVIGGGPNTLETVVVCVGGNDCGDDSCMKRPVVVLPGFGGAADLLAYGYELLEELENSSNERNFMFEFEEKIRAHSALQRLLGKRASDRSAQQQTIENLKRCLTDRKLITVVNIFDESRSSTKNSLDEAILKAIFKSKSSDPKALLSLFTLAQQWNQHETAQLILKQSYSDRHVMLKEFIDPKNCAMTAILRGQSRFFELLIEYEAVDLNKVFTREDMLDIYIKVFITRSAKASRTCVSFFSSILLRNNSADDLAERSLRSKIFCARRIGFALSSILGCALINPFCEDSLGKMFNGSLRFITQESISVVSSNLNEMRRMRSRRSSAAVVETSPYLRSTKYPTKFRDIFLFSLLLKRPQFAQIVWRDSSTEYLGTCLMGSIFLKKLGDNASLLDLHDLAEDYRRMALTWENRTIEMLTRAYDSKPEQTYRMLVRSLNMWQGRTTLELAFYGDEKSFIAHTAVQGKLKQVWYGRIASFSPQWLIYAIALFPVIGWPLVTRIQFVPEVNLDPKHVHRKASVPKKSTIDESFESMEEQTDSSVVTPRQRHALLSEDEDSDDEACEVSLKNEATLLEPVLLYHLRSRRNLPRNSISLWTAVKLIYSAPMVKYLFNSLAMVAFLLLFTYFILTAFAAPIQFTEVLIWIWSFCFFMEEFHSHFSRETISFNQLKTSFFSDSSALITGMAEILMILSIILRCILPLDYYVFPHTTYSLSCLIFWINSLRFLYVMEALGPKVMTIYKMFQELVFFLVIYIILLFAFSVSIHALLSPREEINSIGEFFGVLLHVLYARWWNLAGVGLDASRDDVEDEHFDNGPLVNRTQTSWTHLLIKSDSHGKYYHVVAVILLIIYLFMTNIMLLNMLIAMLSMKVEETRSEASTLWRFSYYRIVTSYYNKVLLPAPFNIFRIFYDIFQFISRWRKRLVAPNVNTELKTYWDPIGPEYTKLDLIEQSVMAQIVTED